MKICFSLQRKDENEIRGKPCRENQRHFDFPIFPNPKTNERKKKSEGGNVKEKRNEKQGSIFRGGRAET